MERPNPIYTKERECQDCHKCIRECPVKAIFTEDDVPAQWKHYIQLNADAFKK